MNKQPLFMLDLFAGVGGASAAMIERGWKVTTVDNDPAHNCDVTADIATWSYHGRRKPDLVWASPPCEQFTRSFLPWLRGKHPDPSLELVRAAMRIIAECRPNWWVIENVRGSSKWLKPILGRPRVYGQAFLWGKFPELGDLRIDPHKERLSSTQRKERACIPYKISLALAMACESSMMF